MSNMLGLYTSVLALKSIYRFEQDLESKQLHCLTKMRTGKKTAYVADLKSTAGRRTLSLEQHTTMEKAAWCMTTDRRYSGSTAEVQRSLHTLCRLGQMCKPCSRHVVSGFQCPTGIVHTRPCSQSAGNCNIPAFPDLK